jgi:hypothetical protein
MTAHDLLPDLGDALPVLRRLGETVVHDDLDATAEELAALRRSIRETVRLAAIILRRLPRGEYSDALTRLVGEITERT